MRAALFSSVARRTSETATRPHQFALVVSSREYLFAASTAEQADQWVAALEAEIEAGQNGLQVLHHRAGLRNDAVGQDSWCLRRVRHLARDEDESIGLDRVAEWRDRLRSAADHVEFHFGILVKVRLQTGAC